MIAELPKLYDLQEIAKYLGKSPETIRRLVRQEKLECLRSGRNTVFTKEHVMAYLERPRGNGSCRIQKDTMVSLASSGSQTEPESGTSHGLTGTELRDDVRRAQKILQRLKGS